MPHGQQICAKDGAELIQRVDDSEDAIAVRLQAYEKQTAPLIDYYQSEGLLVTINGLGSPEAIFQEILLHLGEK